MSNELLLFNNGQFHDLRLPPQNGRNAIPQQLTFGGIASGATNTYFVSDQALQSSLTNAWAMRNELLIMAPLEQRLRLLTLLPWHIEAEGKKDQFKELVVELTDLMARIPYLPKLKWGLAQALWTGRAAVQYSWGWVETLRGSRLIPNYVLPVDGDKLLFQYDDGSPDFDRDNVGIRVAGGNGGKIIPPPDFQRRVVPTQQGMGYFLTREERQLITVHKHLVEDSPYEFPTFAGSINGVGIRNRIYWTWYQLSDAQRLMMNLVEKVGGGVRIYKYPAHDDAAREVMKQLAAEQEQQVALVVPVAPGMDDVWGMDYIQTDSGGIEMIRNLLQQYFGNLILRYILGQTLSSEAAPTGLGSGVADLHRESLRGIVEFDALNLAETLSEIVNRIKNYNFPQYSHVHCKCVLDLESPEVDKRLQALKTAQEMGLQIKANEVYGLLGIERPDADDEILGAQQAGAGGLGWPAGATQQLAARAGDSARYGADIYAKFLAAIENVYASKPAV